MRNIVTTRKNEVAQRRIRVENDEKIKGIRSIIEVIVSLLKSPQNYNSSIKSTQNFHPLLHKNTRLLDYQITHLKYQSLYGNIQLPCPYFFSFFNFICRIGGYEEPFLEAQKAYHKIFRKSRGKVYTFGNGKRHRTHIPMANVYMNGVVDIFDLRIVGRDFGKSSQ